MKRQALAFASVVWLVSAAGTAVAQQAPAVDTAYDVTIDQALGEYDARNFEEALSLFSKAHGISPNARTLRGMAMAEYELRRYVECIGHLQLALASQVKPLTAELRAHADQLMLKARQYVSRVHVQVEPASATPSVNVDGTLATSQADGAYLLQVGEHVIEVQATGFATSQRRVVLQGGDEPTVTIVLREETPAASVTPAAAAASAASAPDARVARDESDDGGSLLESPWFWTAVGVVVVGAVVTAIVVGGAEDEARVADPITTMNTPKGVVVMALH